MKKIMIAVLALLSLNIASAQLNVQHTYAEEYVVYPMRAGVTLKYTKRGDVAEYFLQLNTSNQFDDPIYIYLGTRDKAVASLSQLLNDLFSLGTTYRLSDEHGKSFQAICSNVLGAKGYTIYQSGRAGYAYIRLKQLRDMLEMI